METGPVTSRIAALWRIPSVRIAWALAALVGILLPLAPLARTPGYESALAATVVVALLGGWIGIAAARLERDDDPSQPKPSAPALTTALRATFASFALTCAAILPFLAASALAGALGPRCSILAGLPWYPILPLPSAFLAASLGLGCGALVEGRGRAAAFYCALLALSLAASAWPVFFGPQAFFYNHLLGYFPGPIYDEVVRIEGGLLAHRVLTIAWGFAAIGLVALCRDERGRLGRPRGRPLALGLVAVSCIAIVVGFAGRHQAGWEQSEASIERALGARAEGARCTVIHPRELSSRRLRAFLAECDHRVGELEAFFGVEARRPTVFLYRSREEKRRLTGAARTQFAKPWLGQIHVDVRGSPHPILKHELAHLIAAPLGRGPFGVTAAALGLLPLQGLVEGAAVAADWPAGELSVHEEAQAMRALGLAPRLERIVSASGFWAESSGRAYTYAGSFVRWLIDTRGSEAFGRLYRDGDFAAAYGVGLPALIASWEAFLDEVPLAPGAKALAERRFRRPPIFRRPCAREVALLADEARDALGAGDPLRAADLYSKCLALDPGDPAYLRAQAAAYAEAADPSRILPLLEAMEDHPAKDDLLRASLRTYLADAYAAAGDLDAARLAYEAAGTLILDEDGSRALAVKLEAIQDPALAAVTLPFLASGTDIKLLAVRDLLEVRPDYRTGWYLLGRRLFQRGEFEGALRAFDRALEADELLAALRPEAERLRAFSLLNLERPREACALLRRLAGEGSAYQRAQAGDLLGLCLHQLERG